MSRSFTLGWQLRVLTEHSGLLTAEVKPEAVWFSFADAESKVAAFSKPALERAHRQRHIRNQFLVGEV